MTTVRPATLADLPWLLGELRAFDQFFGATRSLMPDEATATQILTGLVTTGPFFVAEDARGPVGFIAGVAHPHLLNPALRCLSELFWWVREDARGSRAGAALLAQFVAWGRAHCDWIVVTLEAESPVDPRSLEARGFRAKETSYLLEVERPKVDQVHIRFGASEKTEYFNFRVEPT